MVAYHPFDESILDEPFAVYKQLRDEAPVYYLEEFDCWFMSRFGDIWQTLSHPEKLTSSNGITTTHLLTHQTPNAPNISGYDGDEHSAVRRFFSPKFLPRAAREMEALAQQFATEAVDRVLAQGGGCAVGDLGGHVASRVACTILGIPLEDADQVMSWVNTFFERESGHRGSTERGAGAAKELGLYLFQLSREARKNGTAAEGSVLDMLLKEEVNGHRCDDKDIAIHLNMMAIGGTETFPKVFSATLYRLWQHPDQRAKLTEDPSLIPWAFHEALRFDMPTHMLGRTVKEDIEMHGQTLREGQHLMFMWGAANRDEREFDDPERFDIERKAPRILSFGAGDHMCLGTHMAKMEGRVLLGEVMRRMPEYVADESKMQRIVSEFFRGFLTLPVTV